MAEAEQPQRLRADHQVTVDDVRQLMGSSTAHFALQLRNRIRKLIAGEVSALWPEARGLMPPEFGRDVDRLCVLELAKELSADEWQDVHVARTPVPRSVLAEANPDWMPLTSSV